MEVKTVPISKLIHSTEWVRFQTKEGLEDDGSSIKELAISLKQRGQKYPLIVRESPEVKGSYIVDDGNRRLAALKRIGAIKADVIVSTDDSFFNAFVGNFQRMGLTDVEKGKWLHDAKEHFGEKFDTAAELTTFLAKTLGVKERTVYHYLKVFEKAGSDVTTKKTKKTKKSEKAPARGPHAKLTAVSVEKRILDVNKYLQKNMKAIGKLQTDLAARKSFLNAMKKFKGFSGLLVRLFEGAK